MNFREMDILNNKLRADFGDLDSYAVIIGESPSKGARSPILWNRAFSKLVGESVKMVPFDVSPENFELVMQLLFEDKRCLGGSITMPYKVVSVQRVSCLEDSARRIGAINCFYRNSEGLFVGANTDSLAFIDEFKSAIESSNISMKTPRVLLLGSGGVGSAVAIEIAKYVGEKQGKLFIFNRSQPSGLELCERCLALCDCEYVEKYGALGALQIDSIINCTSIGFSSDRIDSNGLYSLQPFNPLAEVPKFKSVSREEGYASFVNENEREIAINSATARTLFLSLYPKLVMDVIYDPEKTELLKLAEEQRVFWVNGRGMNIMQAVHGFKKTCGSILPPNAILTDIYEAMVSD